MLDRIDNPETRHRIGRFAWAMAWVGLVVGQLHALSRFATDDGREDLAYPLTAAWAVPAAEALRPLLDWAHPNLVYLHYGKVWFLVFAAFTACAWLVYRSRRPAGFEKWAWRVMLVGYAVSTAGVFFGYWTQWTPVYTEPWFSLGWYLDVPGLALSIVGSTVLGITLLVKRFRPVLPAVLLALTLPIAVILQQVTSLGSVVLPIAFAFGLLGLRLGAGAQIPAPTTNAVPVEAQ